MMHTKTRKKTPKSIETEVLAKSRRRCCICFALNRDLTEKRGQIAHLDHNPQNWESDNLAFLCLEHHDQYDSRTSQSKNLTINEVKGYRDTLYESFSNDPRFSVVVGAVDPFSPLSELPRERFASTLPSFLDGLKKFVVADQIPESGGWALSQAPIFPYWNGSPPTDIDKREGGIISTYIAVRALRASGMPVNSYEPPGKAATEYLLKRQKKHTAKGAFGRFSVSRSGEEIVPSFRHTALACLTLMAMNGPPSAVLEGIRYLVSMTVDDLRDDAAPSIACAASLLALECAASSAWGEQHLPRKDVDRVKEVLNDHRADLMLALESEARSPTTYAPLWEPYAHRGRMIYDSALTTLDLLTLLTDPPWNIVVAALYHLARGKMELGLPYDPSLDKPDVGISAYFATICRRGPVLQRLRTTEGEDSILSAADDCIDFVLKEWGNPIYMERTYCDTVANGLLLKLGDYGIRDLSSVL